MADIDVVPKGRSNAWVWILLAILILVALLFFVFAGRADASTTLQQVDRMIHAPASPVLLV
jgi:uncharacterized integral membrane protein